MTEQQLRSFIADLRRRSTEAVADQRPDDLPTGDLLAMAADELEKTLPPPDLELLEQIRDAYNGRCTTMPTCTALTPKRISNLRARLKEDKARRCAEWWRQYFEHAASSNFLSGRQSHWKAGFDWLINRSNMIKVLEGNYHNRPVPIRGQAEQDAFLDSVSSESRRRAGAR